ncbi:MULTISPECIES: hypothetical protein [Paraburkholderia]|nr:MULTISPECIES: hypothetical protein [Paraburkholderia]
MLEVSHERCGAPPPQRVTLAFYVAWALPLRLRASLACRAP